MKNTDYVKFTTNTKADLFYCYKHGSFCSKISYKAKSLNSMIVIVRDIEIRFGWIESNITRIV